MRVASRTGDPIAQQNARLVVARADYASRQFSLAYAEAQGLRSSFPGGGADAEARALARLTLRARPDLVDTSSIHYQRSEATLLLREGQLSAAAEQIRAALALQPDAEARAELIWLLADASRANPRLAKAALTRYLGVMPRGPHAVAALCALARLVWHINDTAQARVYFDRVVRGFPTDRLAPYALFETGRAYEDDRQFQSARAVYLRLLKRYPTADLADEARFRAPFMTYMLGHYDRAADEFGAAKLRASKAPGRDAFAYWQARSLDRNGEDAQARPIFDSVASSTDSNYYAALASLRIHQPPTIFPAAAAANLVAGEVPAADSAASFHLNRVAILRDLGLRELEPPELRAIMPQVWTNPALSNFLLAEFQAAGAWSDAIELSTTLAKRGQLDPLIAERIRYPRGYWNLVTACSGRKQLDPYIVAAVIRQESLFNPRARSSSDARGLMQLLLSTAERYTGAAGVIPAPLDLYDPEVSVRLGTAYLHDLLGMFDGNVFKAVAAYNAGENAVAGWNTKYPGDNDQWVENIAFPETRNYVKKVIGGRREYGLLYRAPTVRPDLNVAPRS
jgi:peptidoglycan lytic transglycosylase